MKILYLDTETTGLDPNENCIIQVAGIIEIDGEVKETFDFQMKPRNNSKVDPKALETTGLTIEQIKSFPDRPNVYNSLIKIFGKYIDKFDKSDKLILAGQNVRFDLDMMISFWKEFDDKYLGAFISYGKKLDLLYIASYLDIMGHIQIDNCKLETIAKCFNVEFDPHDALDDIRATKQVLMNINESISFGSEPVCKLDCDKIETALSEIRKIFDKTCSDCLINKKCDFDKCPTYKLKDQVEPILDKVEI